MPCRKSRAHALHGRLQRIADAAHGGKVLLRHLRQLCFYLTVLCFQLLAQPLFQLCIITA